MRQNTLPVSGPVTVSVENVGGDLQIVGWERAEVTAKTDDNKLELTTEGETIHVQSRGDLILYVAREVSIRILSVGGDADLRALAALKSQMLAAICRCAMWVRCGLSLWAAICRCAVVLALFRPILWAGMLHCMRSRVM
jgi:hypothetical protein